MVKFHEGKIVNNSKRQEQISKIWIDKPLGLQNSNKAKLWVPKSK